MENPNPTVETFRFKNGVTCSFVASVPGSTMKTVLKNVRCVFFVHTSTTGLRGVHKNKNVLIIVMCARVFTT